MTLQRTETEGESELAGGGVGNYSDRLCKQSPPEPLSLINSVGERKEPPVTLSLFSPPPSVADPQPPSLSVSLCC